MDGIYKNDMAYVGDTPWHGKGTMLEPNQPIEVWMETAGFNWEVMKGYVRYYANKEKTEFKTMENNIVLFRSDTLEPLSVVSTQFNPVQPQEVLEFYRDLVEQYDFQLETAGVLMGGRKLWAMAKTSEGFTLIDGDEVKAYLLLATANDGSYSTTAKFTGVRTVCQNTLELAMSEGSGAQVKVNHRSIFNPRNVKIELGIFKEDWEQFELNARKMTERKITIRERAVYFISIFHNPDKRDEFGVMDFSDVPQRKVKRLIELTLNGKGVQMESAMSTLWGAYNAIAEEFDWHSGRNQDSGLNSAWFGNGSMIKRRAYARAVEILNGEDLIVPETVEDKETLNNLVDELVR
jgi:phage/plasmid-like protein (TIGR03299 family)